VSGCPDIEIEAIDATVAILDGVGPAKGTIVHFSGSGGTSFDTRGTTEYQNAGFRQVYVKWSSAWEQTQSLGIKAAGCRPSTVLDWIFHDPTLHAGARDLAFCGEGHSGGSGQLGYALAHYGLADKLDYVNEIAGPPFARIDVGCDGDAPATDVVCGATVTTRLPPVLDGWENNQAPVTCGGHNIPSTELARWRDDSIAIGGMYSYPRTQVQFFDCTNQATAVTAMAQHYYKAIRLASNNDPALSQFHCYSQADGCQGEGLGTTGDRDAVTAMITGCTPHHQLGP
jgi:hypothetical protein